MVYESIYRQLYNDQLEGATEAYLAEFESTFSPEMIDWNNCDEFAGALCSLLCELHEDRSDFDTLIAEAGLTETDLRAINYY